MTRLISFIVVTSCILLVEPAGASAQPAAQASAQGLAQDTEKQVRWNEIVLKDGSRILGTIVSEDEAQVVLKNQSGTVVAAKRADIASIKEVTGAVVDGRFVLPDPNATRLFFGPTGRSLARGQTYLGVYEFLMPFVQVGITDRLSIGGGTPLVFGIGESDRPFWITPKLQLINHARTQVAVGTFHVFNASGDGGGVAYAVGTHGGSDASFTIGGGFAYGTGDSRSGVLMVGGERQIRHNLKLISENYVWKDGHGITSGGVRFFGERLSADLAIAIPIGIDELFGFPVVNFVYVF
jgi:filamentous hemagglutinin family protein